MKQKLYIVIALLLALPMLATAAQDFVPVPYSCGAGSAFTIKIPVRIPANTSGEYVWYKNDTLMEWTRTALTPGARTIAYTVPAHEAYGDVLLLFKYRMYKPGCSDCDEWQLSPLYLVSFLAPGPPQVAAVMGDEMVCTGISATFSTTYIPDVYYAWTVPLGWTITAGINTHSITVTAGTASGFVSVTPANFNGVGAVRTLAVGVVGAITPGTASVADYTCTSDIVEAGVASVVDYTCDSDISSPGVASVVDYTCTSDVISAGVISVEAY